MIDSHCHLQYFEGEELERTLDQAREVGVRGFLVPAIKLSDANTLLEMCAQHDDVWCALGVHPHEAKTWQKGDAERLAALLNEPGVVAVGECGLDFFYDHSPREQQIRAMTEQWTVALEHGLPVIVHNRDSNPDMRTEVEREEFSGLSGVLHSYAGGLELANVALEKGFYLGLSGMVTFPKADNVREVLPTMGRDRLLVETDTPYLAPVPHRGDKNRPAWVVEVAKRVAEEWRTEVEEVSRVTTENFFRLFERAEEQKVLRS